MNFLRKTFSINLHVSKTPHYTGKANTVLPAAHARLDGFVSETLKVYKDLGANSSFKIYGTIS